MSPKNRLLLLPLVVTAIAVAPAAANATTDICGKHLITTCNSCHANNDPCQRLGKPVKLWRELLIRMDYNGAGLSKEEIETLAACLSEPSAAAKDACK